MEIKTEIKTENIDYCSDCCSSDGGEGVFYVGDNGNNSEVSMTVKPEICDVKEEFDSPDFVNNNLEKDVTGALVMKIHPSTSCELSNVYSDSREGGDDSGDLNIEDVKTECVFEDCRDEDHSDKFAHRLSGDQH